jgi:hypothetical protein
MSSDEYVAPSPHVGSADASRRSEVVNELKDARVTLAKLHGFAALMSERNWRDMKLYIERLSADQFESISRLLDEPRGLSAAEEPCSERVNPNTDDISSPERGEGE